MKLAQALQKKSSLQPAVREGLGALRTADVKLIHERARRDVGDSIDIDEAAKAEHPTENRWDYLLSVPSARRLVAFEPHSPAKDSEIKVVIAKRRFALDYLRAHLPAAYRVSDWYWASRGKVTFMSMESARRRLNQNGIEFVGRVLRKI